MSVKYVVIIFPWISNNICASLLFFFLNSKLSFQAYFPFVWSISLRISFQKSFHVIINIIMSNLQFSTVQFSRSVIFDSLQPHEPQYTRPPCPSPTPRVHPNPCPLSWWCHPTISSSVVPFSSCPQSFPASGSFQMSQLSASVGQSIGVSSSTSVPPMNTQDWLSRVFSNTTVQKHQFFSAQLSL